MSAFEPREIDVAASSSARAPEAALAEALSRLAHKLADAGGAPFHMTAMSWTAPDPAAVHPRRHAIDRLYREAFGGFRPPIKIVPGARDALTIRTHAVVPPASEHSTPVWRGLTPPELARQYSPRTQVPDMQPLFRRWSADGAAYRATHGGLDIAFGPSAYETLDYYHPAGVARPPLWMFIHGGYWQASDKDQHAQFTAGMVHSGYAVANLNYGLCPDVTLEQIVRQVRNALQFLVGEADGFGFDPARIHVAGHSAGGHLAAMVAADETAPPVRSALLLSGLFDLTPLSLLPVARLLGILDRNVVEKVSPIRRRPRPGVRVGVAVGGLESEEFKWQSTEIATAWRTDAFETIGGTDHFSLLDGLNSGTLFDFARDIAGS
jgi:arylformamidase